MKTTYWYFEFTINDSTTQYYRKDHSIVSSADDFFPVSSILEWKDEEFGEDADLFIEYAVQISPDTYTQMLERLEREINDRDAAGEQDDNW